jgi:hypothetical protein
MNFKKCVNWQQCYDFTMKELIPHTSSDSAPPTVKGQRSPPTQYGWEAREQEDETVLIQYDRLTVKPVEVIKHYRQGTCICEDRFQSMIRKHFESIFLDVKQDQIKIVPIANTSWIKVIYKLKA